MPPLPGRTSLHSPKSSTMPMLTSCKVTFVSCFIFSFFVFVDTRLGIQPPTTPTLIFSPTNRKNEKQKSGTPTPAYRSRRTPLRPHLRCVCIYIRMSGDSTLSPFFFGESLFFCDSPIFLQFFFFPGDPPPAQTHKHTHSHTFTHIHTITHTHIHTLSYIHTLKHTHSHTHTHTHTHIHESSSSAQECLSEKRKKN
jgi:hypothetical protein